MKKSFGIFAAVVMSVVTGCAATPVVPFSQVGDSIDLSKLNNQHGTPYSSSEKKNIVMFVHDMKAKKLISKSLEKINLNCLTDGQVSYVADISGMPSFISSFIAVPKMRKYPYPIWLDKEGTSTQALPVKEDSVSLISLEQHKISDIQFVEDEASLTKQLVSLCGEGSN